MRYPTFAALALAGLAVAAQQQPFALGNSVADLLTSSARASIFYDYVRSFPSLQQRILSPGATTVLCPLNAAIMNLHRKPHEGPAPVGTVSDLHTVQEREDNEEVNRKYLRAFIELHMLDAVVPVESDAPFATLRDGRSAHFSGPTDARVLMPGSIKVVGTVEAGNGQIVWLDGALSLEE